MKLQFTHAAQSDTGLVRSGNEDRWVHTATPNGELVYAVADGMGGHQAGEIASKESVDGLEELFSLKSLNETTWGNHTHDSPLFFSQDYITQTVKKINSRIYHMSLENPALKGMGTTLTLSLIQNDRMMIAHVGDSRAYLLRKKKIMRLTKDHSLVQREVDLGLLTPDEALHDPRKNIITKALGIMPEVEPDIYHYQLQKKDLLLLCSDGLYDLVSEKEIAAACMEPSLSKAVDKLIALAKHYGGKDNITVILVHADVQKTPRQPRKCIFNKRKKLEDQSL